MKSSPHPSIVWKPLLCTVVVVLWALCGTGVSAWAQEPAASDGSPAATEKSKAIESGDAAPAEETGPAEESGALSIGADLAIVLAKKYPESTSDLRAIEQQTRLVLEHALPATVGLQINSSAGSGVIVSADGLILTAGHVAGKPDRDVRVILSDGRRVRAKTLGINHRIDSGMIQIIEKGPWPHANLAKGREIRPGQWVIAIGHPGGYRPDRAPPVRLGRILFNNASVLCTDCTLVGGDSGGPLFNMRGEVVGIHIRIGRDITSNFHVPIETFHTTWDRLAAGEMWGGKGPKEQQTRVRPFLGVHLDGRESRPTVAQVNPGSPADRAGIRVGDVFLTFGGRHVSTRFDLMRQLRAKKPRQRVKIGLERNGENVQVELTLTGISRKLPGGLPEKLPEIKPAEGEKSESPKNAPLKDETPKEDKPGDDESTRPDGEPNPKADETDKDPPPQEKLPGQDLALSRGNVLEILGVDLDPAALRCLVSHVRPDSLAAAARILPGDVIVGFGKKEINSAEDLRSAVAEHVGGDVVVHVRRGSREIELAVRMEERP